MRNYELVIVMDGKVSAAKKKTVIQELEKLVSSVKGKVGKMQDLGAKDLAYKIKKSVTGAYVVLQLELGSEGVKELAGKLKLEGDLIRYLLTRKD